MAFWDRQDTIAKIQKNKVEKIIVSLCIVDNKEFVDIRTYRLYKNNEYTPTSKGIVLSLQKKQELINALNRIKE